MAVKDVFSAHLVTESGYEDITSGILNVDIKFGTDVYEGPQQQIDTGLFTIVSRGSILDPSINSNVVEGAEIEFRDSRDVEEEKTNVFFAGFITDIDVQYQREDDPIITITGTDAFGLLQRTVVSQDMKEFALSWSAGEQPDNPDLNGPSLTTLVEHTTWLDYVPIEVNVIDPILEPIVPGQIDNAIPYNVYLGYNPARYLPDLGETLLEVLNKYTQTNLNYCTINYRETPKVIDVYPYAKYNAFFWPPIQDPALEFPVYNFSSYPEDNRPYESILINNRYSRKSQSLAISNETRLWNEISYDDPVLSTITNYPPFKVDEYSTSVATNLDTIFASPFIDNDALDLYATDIFQVVNFGSDEIQQITFDNARKEDIDDDRTYSFSQLNQFIRIKHKVNENYTIDRFYDIAGISHNITPDKWEMGFTFKPAQNEIAFNYQGQLPTIQMNSLIGDSNFNFTATITDFPIENIDKVIWCLNGTNSNVNEMWTFTADGTRYKDGLQRNGLTQTWNFDDDGILEGVYFGEPFPTGGFGTGEWYVIPYIILKNGWVIAPHVKLTVGTPEVDAEFLWSQNLTNNFGRVTFTDDSRNNEIGEPDSYFWDFGDGNTSTLQNPIHTYDPAPDQTTYDVSLTVFAYGDNQEKVYDTRTRTVTLVQPVMTADFSYFITDSTVQFINQSTNLGFPEPDAFLWDFGDGTTSTVSAPLKTYSGAQGESLTFPVTLTIRNIWEQTASVTKNITVTPSFTTGTFGVQQIRLRPAVAAQFAAGTRFTPYMYSFKGLSTNANANLLYLKSLNLDMSLNQNWYNASGALFASGSSFNVNTLNLTRDPSITSPSNYGASGVATNNNSTYWKIATNAPYDPVYTYGDFSLDFRDVTIGSTSQWQTVYLDVFAPNYGWVQIGFFPTGKGPVGKNNTLGAASITEATRKLVKNKVLPLNNFNFTYTFGNNGYTATFTPLVSGPYLWTFPGGVTSTLQNPTFTFPNRGEHYVSLQATGGTIVEKINVLPVMPNNFRYIRIKQKLHDGAHQWDTPFIANLKAQTESGSYVSSITTTNPQSIVSKRITQGTAWSPSYTGATTFDPLNSQNLTNDTGLRFSTTNTGNTSEWDLVVDFKETVYSRVHDITLDVAVPTVSSFPLTYALDMTYEIFTTTYTGNFASSTNPDNIGGGATWTKIGEIKPTIMYANKLTTYSLIPS